jgi:hypothetical protein
MRSQEPGVKDGASTASPVAAGDPLPADCELIEVHVSELEVMATKTERRW